MLIFQFEYEKLNEEEQELIYDFGEFLKDIVYSEIFTKTNMLKIKLRIPYLYTVRWIQWIKRKITIEQIFDTINNSFKFVKHKDNIWILELDTSVLIPNTQTSMSRLIRFLEYGDLQYKGMNMFKKLEHKYNWNKLNSLWSMYCLKHLGNLPESKINGVY